MFVSKKIATTKMNVFEEQSLTNKRKTKRARRALNNNNNNKKCIK